MQRVGPYEVLGELGRGGMGYVLRVKAADGRTLALKLLHKLGSGTAAARFERERRLLSQLGAEGGFVPLLDAGDSPQGPWLVMPFLEGGTLRARLHAGPLEPARALELARALGAAMGRAHDLGIVHRDLKPENVLFDGAGRPFIADLGLAKHWRRDVPGASQSLALSKDGQILGTARYMAPEQALAASEVGPAADVFALGAILYECLVGEPPFVGETVTEVLARAATGSFEPVRSSRSDVPAWVDDLVRRALAPEVRARIPDGRAFVAALDARGGGRSVRRGPLLVAAGVLLVVLAAALLRLRQAPADSCAPPAPPPAAAAPVATRVPTPTRAPLEPDWFLALRADERPPLPLPRGIHFGEGPGEYVNEADRSVLVWVAPGAFLMGSHEGEPIEKPVHEVRLSGYWIGKYEVRVSEFERFVDATGHVTVAERDGTGTIDVDSTASRMPKSEARWRVPHGDGVAALGSHPVAQVSRDDAAAYCAWAGLELPTEAQWERAAAWDPGLRRARRFAWGDAVPRAGSPPVGNVFDETAARFWRPKNAGEEWFSGYEDGFARAAPVGSFPRGASPCGALDMTGNVSEWCRDAFDPEFYSRSPPVDPERRFDERSGEDLAVIRGEEWGTSIMNARAAHRFFIARFACYEETGFRVALRADARR